MASFNFTAPWVHHCSVLARIIRIHRLTNWRPSAENWLLGGSSKGSQGSVHTLAAFICILNFLSFLFHPKLKFDGPSIWWPLPMIIFARIRERTLGHLPVKHHGSCAGNHPWRGYAKWRKTDIIEHYQFLKLF